MNLGLRRLNTVPMDPNWGMMIDPEWIARLDRVPFLARCRAGTANPAELRSFTIQQQHYSRHFTRYLCALISNLTDDSDRYALTQNLFEEMGLGGMGQIPHSRIYRDMMEKMGINQEAEPPRPETLELIRLMHSSCSNEDPIIGLAALCLGAEAIVPHLYSQVVSGFLAAGESLECLEFFTLHIEGDDEHAVTLRAIIERELGRNPWKLPILRETAERLIAARIRFLEAVSLNTEVSYAARLSY